MPTYLYICEKNNQEFEEFHSIKTELEECPICKEKGFEQHKPKRLIAGGSGKGIVELSGQDLIDKSKSDAQKFKKEVYSSEALYSNILGESRYQSIQTQMDKRKK